MSRKFLYLHLLFSCYRLLGSLCWVFSNICHRRILVKRAKDLEWLKCNEGKRTLRNAIWFSVQLVQYFLFLEKYKTKKRRVCALVILLLFSLSQQVDKVDRQTCADMRKGWNLKSMKTMNRVLLGFMSLEHRTDLVELIVNSFSNFSAGVLFWEVADAFLLLLQCSF